MVLLIAYLVVLRLFKSKDMVPIHKENSQRLYESNYRKLVAMLPDVDAFNHVSLSSDDHLVNLSIDVIERTPYTILLSFVSTMTTSCEFAPRTELQVRMFHDARVAEVIMVQGIRKISSHYKYPNDKMHYPDEKRQGNRLLAEMLNFCYNNNYKKTYIPIQTELN